MADLRTQSRGDDGFCAADSPHDESATGSGVDMAVGLFDVKAVAVEYFGVSAAEFNGESRGQTVAVARAFAMCAAKRLTGASDATIGDVMGHKSRARVGQAVKKVEAGVKQGEIIRWKKGDIWREEGASVILKTLEENAVRRARLAAGVTSVETRAETNNDTLTAIASLLDGHGMYENRTTHVCILLADLVGSTEFKRYHGMVQGLAKTVMHNKVAGRSIETCGGRVVKYVADAVMGMFEGERCEAAALASGLHMIREMSVANEQQGWYGFPYAMSTRIGVCSGPVWMFVYQNSAEDPQGATIDIAARLAGLAAPDQVLCTQDTYGAACKDGQFPQPDIQFTRYLNGIRGKQALAAISPEGYVCMPPYSQPHAAPLELELKKAFHLVHLKRHAEALTLFQQIYESCPENFHANVFLAEQLLRESTRTDEAVLGKLQRAEEHLDQARCARLNSCQVWRLLSSVHFKQFELQGDDKSLQLAISEAREACRLAQDWPDMGGFLQATVWLIQLLHALYTKTGNQHALDEAKQLCVELEPHINGCFNECRSDFYVAYAAIQLHSGSTDYDNLEEVLQKARGLNPKNYHVYEVIHDVMRQHHPNGGIAGALNSFGLP